MVERQLEIVNRLGLHARAAAKLVHTAGRFSSDIQIAKDGQNVDAKSILGIMALGAAQGTMIHLVCEGPDEDEALAAISELIANRFDEAQ
ncbi:MAG: HPr family phosphocarrier protein [Acidobacteriota bacterium]